MRLEEEIKQPRFGNEHHKAIVNILYTSSWLSNKNIAFLKGFNVSPEQFNVLRILRGSHPSPMRLTDIADRMIEKNSNCTRLVEKLRQKGMVERKLCESNRRQVDISITATGLKALAAIDREEGQWLSVQKSITKTEAAELNRILDKLRS
ncbi:MAG TPA: MarR family transcriptional regulator [Cyclobacteriaceae bacterium]|nr:MarR family transcriptional regulator [Cyclobacteriaceae bacterium]MCB9238121.1 MarR family transcriptional regulator [Flammeovirgaceae bacterium]MCB0499541.1 MarR family transcriptional regulator [Cyclobacteriaceae bacterium]MCO5272487.1 MarR family transcriptional regulator [Cyclobacteriaceae bacterium]MCW5901555.1 MarR family transcriptional regulator [Cyclobacteriaceae bacterium]